MINQELECMKAYVLYYDGFAEFEIVIACGNLAHKSDIIPIALENREYISEEKQIFIPKLTVDEVKPDDIDCLIIPGGNINTIKDNQTLKDLLHALDSKNKLIAGICGGAMLLGYLGLLKGKRFNYGAAGFELKEEEYSVYFSDAIRIHEDVVLDGNILTAQGQAFIEFGIEIAQYLGIYENEQERERDYKWLKNIK